MPELNALLLSEKYRQALLNGERASAVRLVNAYGMVYQRLQSRLDALTAELDLLLKRDGAVSVWKFQRIDQMQALRRQVLDEIGRFAPLLEDSIDQGARNAITVAQLDGYHLVQAALPGVPELDAAIMAQWQRMDPAAVESMIGFLQEDSPLKKGIRANLAPAIADQVEAGLIESVALGYSPRTLAARFVKELGTGLNWSLTTARTAQLSAYRESTRAAYIANRDIVPQWKWVAARKSTTCGSCLAQDGSLHDVEERLNDHHNGKCTAVPVTVGYEALGIKVPPAPSTDDYLRSLSPKEQQSALGGSYNKWKSGEIRFNESAGQWFERQPDAVKVQMLGPGKATALKSGTIKLGQLSTVTENQTWGTMRVETPLKDLVGEGATA